MDLTRREVLLGTTALSSVLAFNLVRVSDAAAAASRRSLHLRPGVCVGPCTVSRVLPVENGALPIELVDPAGERFVVEVHRFDERAPGIARAGSLAVYLRNGGTGATRSDETHGLGAMALASLLEAREQAGKPVPRLASILERWQCDPPPAR
jgi:hypothetical protein